MTLEHDAVASATIELLEARLHRLTYLLTGATEWTGVPTTPEKPTSLDETVSRQLARLERELEKLSRSVPAVRDVIQLRMYSPAVYPPPARPGTTIHSTRLRSAQTQPQLTPVLLQTTTSQTSSNNSHPTKSPKTFPHAPSPQSSSPTPRPSPKQPPASHRSTTCPSPRHPAPRR